MVNRSNNALIDLRNAVNRKEIRSNKNPEKIIDIVEWILNFNKQQKGKGLSLNFDCPNLKKLSPKQVLQTSPLVHAQVQAGKAAGNLLNKIRQIIYSLHSPKKNY